MNKIENFVKQEIEEKLDQYESLCIYGCDLAFELFESENCDGSFTCNKYKSIEWIKENFEELEDIIKDIEFNLGKENIPDCFDEPEKFQVVIILEVAYSLLSQCKLINDNWNDEIELTEENIKIIKSQLNEL